MSYPSAGNQSAWPFQNGALPIFSVQHSTRSGASVACTLHGSSGSGCVDDDTTDDGNDAYDANGKV